MSGPQDLLQRGDDLKQDDARLPDIENDEVQNLLTNIGISPHESVQESLKPEENEPLVNWFEVLQPILSKFCQLRGNTQVRFHFDYFVDQNLQIPLDRNRFEKIIFNFLSGIMNLNPPGGKVEFIAEEHGDHLMITVHDNGQAEGISSPSLSIAKEIAEWLHGRIWVVHHPGEGNSWYFCFPRSPSDKKGFESLVFSHMNNVAFTETYRLADGPQRLLFQDDEVREKGPVGAADAAWEKDVKALFLKNLANTHCKVDWVAYAIHLSERQFSRRLKQLTGLTPNQYLREMRLQTAMDFLQAGKYSTVKEVSIAVGFMDSTYFSGLFRARFGILPSECLK
jgi:AraC-like DNA-binding protein